MTLTKLPPKFIAIGLITFLIIGAASLGAGYLYLSQAGFFSPISNYSIDRVVLTNRLDEDERPIGSAHKFRPYEPIIGWVGTKGTEGAIGFRWFHEDELLFEYFGQTQDHQIATYLESNDIAVLTEGDYRLEIHTTGVTPQETIEFTVKQYRPQVIPPQPIPTGHQRVEPSALVEVPFAFDEVWLINGAEWKINEVKLVFLDDKVFPAIVVKTDHDLSQLAEAEATKLANPLVAYALKNEYLERARSLKVDGVTYPLNEQIYVNFVNPEVDPLTEPGKMVYRVNFDITNLN
jgi:hypothetical protein